MACDVRDIVQSRIFYFREYEPDLDRLIRDALGPGDVFVDVGANVGYFSLLASRLVGEHGKVVAIDADPQNFSSLKANLWLNHVTNVIAVNVAVTESECHVETLVADKWNRGNATVKQLGRSEKATSSISGKPLPLILGEWLRAANFIKIDIEGSEGPALASILATLTELRDDLTIAAEIQPENAHLIKEFRSSGFQVFALRNRYDVEFYLTCKLRPLRPHASHLTEVSGYLAGVTDYVLARTS